MPEEESVSSDYIEKEYLIWLMLFTSAPHEWKLASQTEAAQENMSTLKMLIFTSLHKVIWKKNISIMEKCENFTVEGFVCGSFEWNSLIAVVTRKAQLEYHNSYNLNLADINGEER